LEKTGFSSGAIYYHHQTPGVVAKGFAAREVSDSEMHRLIFLTQVRVSDET